MRDWFVYRASIRQLLGYSSQQRSQQHSVTTESRNLYTISHMNPKEKSLND